MSPFVLSKYGWVFAAIVVILLGAGIYMYMFPATPNPTPTDDFHIHADFAVFINGEKFNFAQEKYMSESTGHKLSPYVHLHDLDGNIIHVHAPNVTLGNFFESLGMRLRTTTDEISFTLDDGTIYSSPRYGCYSPQEGQPEVCVDPAPDANRLAVYINGQPFFGKAESYVMNDLDRILISFGKINEVDPNEEFTQVTDNACIQSAKCPERGEPGDESTCTTAGGCSAGPIAT